MTPLTKLTSSLLGSLCLLQLANSQQFTPVTQHPNFQFGAGQALLLTDGSVIVHDESAFAGGELGSDWKRLTPDASGSYINGTWSSAGAMQTNYGPLYFASAVLADGRLVCLGGEYNLAQGGVDTNLGAIYDPVANSWAPLAGPGWANIGDSPCAVLPDGRLFLGRFLGSDYAILDPVTLTWTGSGGAHGKADIYAEEGLCLMPDNSLLTVDCENGNNAEKFFISALQWASAGATVDFLPKSPGSGYVPEMGPLVLRPDGTVIAFGASGHNNLYTPGTGGTGTWSHVADFPLGGAGGQYGCVDAPACLLPSGNVLVAASIGVFSSPTHFWEFDGANLTQVGSTPNSGFISSYMGRMLMLPSGQVMFTDGSNDVEIYTPTGTPGVNWRPAIVTCPPVLQSATTVTITGRQFNGLSQGASYGDDAASATNYPIVRITNVATGHVRYCRTHNHSSMGVATGTQIISTQVDIPFGIEFGPSNLEVVANGIASSLQPVTIANQIISGNVSLGGFTGARGGTAITIQIRQVGTQTVLDTEITNMDSNGNFTFGTNVVNGTYDMTAKCSHWLKRIRHSVIVSGGGATGVNFTLINGDVNGDNHNNLADFSLFKAAFGSNRASGNWNANADLNGDGSVNLADFAIFKANFGLSGDQ